MSEGTPISRLPRLTNPRKLAYSRVTLAGSIASNALDRFANAMHSVSDISATLQFFISEEGKVRIDLDLAAKVEMVCQRCMSAMPVQVLETKVSVAIVRDEEGAKQLPKHLEAWIVPDDDVDLYAYIEDELLLSLPVVAYHDESCVDEALLTSGEASNNEENERPDNPFSVLASLKDK